MGFLTPRTTIESWLEQASATFRPLSDREYAEVVAGWRNRFETVLENKDYVRGRSVNDIAQSLLPSDVFVFSLPGYRLLPARTNPSVDLAYGYEARGLRKIDFEIANRADAIIVDKDFAFTCLCTNEAGAFADPQLAPASVARRHRIF
jgi:hypothetical protein